MSILMSFLGLVTDSETCNLNMLRLGLLVMEFITGYIVRDAWD